MISAVTNSNKRMHFTEVRIDIHMPMRGYLVAKFLFNSDNTNHISIQIQMIGCCLFMKKEVIIQV